MPEIDSPEAVEALKKFKELKEKISSGIYNLNIFFKY